jgi:hypothetical protein
MLYNLDNMNVDINSTELKVNIDLSYGGNVNDPERLDNIMVWIDGNYVTSMYDYNKSSPFNGHSVSRIYNNGKYSIQVNLQRNIFKIYEGLHEIIISLWQADNKNIAYYRKEINIAPVVLPSLYPGTIIRGLYNLTIDKFKTNKQLLLDTKAACVNTVREGIFNNPADNPGIDTIEKWRVWSLETLRAKLEWCRDNDFLLFGYGDDLLRSEKERDWVLNTTWAEQAIRETFRLYNQYFDVWVGVAMQDEISGLVLDIHRKIKQWCDEEHGPKLSWPNRWKDTVIWENSDVAHFAFRYMSKGDNAWRHGEAETIASLWEYKQPLLNAMQGIPNGMPLILEHGAMSYYYTKKVDGGEYSPSYDILQDYGNTLESVVMSAWIALALGACGIITYGHDINWKEERLKKPIGTIDLQTGVEWGTDLGTVLSDTYKAIEKYEALLTGTYYDPCFIDDWIIGRRLNLEFWINTNSLARDLPSRQGKEILSPVDGLIPYIGQLIPPGGVLFR